MLQDVCNNQKQLAYIKSVGLQGYTDSTIYKINRDTTMIMTICRKNFKNNFAFLKNFKCILNQSEPQVQSCDFFKKSDQFVLLESNQINLYQAITQQSKKKCLDVCIGIHNCSCVRCGEDDNQIFSSQFDEIYIWERSLKGWNLIQKIILRQTMELKFKQQNNNMLILQDYGYPKCKATFYLLSWDKKKKIFQQYRTMYRIESTNVLFLDDNQILFSQKSGQLKLYIFNKFRSKKILNIKTIPLKIARMDEIINQLYFCKKQKLILVRAARTLYFVKQDQNNQYHHCETKLDCFQQQIILSDDGGTLFFILKERIDQYKVI